MVNLKKNYNIGVFYTVKPVKKFISALHYEKGFLIAVFTKNNKQIFKYFLKKNIKKEMTKLNHFLTYNKNLKILINK